jgi:SpoU rRNA methylase family enzyme
MVDSSETLNPTWTFNVGKRSRPTNQRTKHQKTNKKVYFIIANSTTDTLKQQAQESKALLFYLLEREKNYSALGCKPISLADVVVTEPSGGDTGLDWYLF